MGLSMVCYRMFSEGTPSGRLAKGFGKAIGEKLDSFKPPSVSIKWNASQGKAIFIDTSICSLQSILKTDKILCNL